MVTADIGDPRSRSTVTARSGCVDTGCATALHWVNRKVRAEGCATKLAVGLAELSIPQITTQVRLGEQLVEAVPTGLHRGDIFPGEAGLLGNGLLTRFGTVTLDTRAGQLLLGTPDERP